MIAGLKEDLAERNRGPPNGFPLTGVHLRSGASRLAFIAWRNVDYGRELPMPQRSATPNMPGGVMLNVHPPIAVAKPSVRLGAERVKGNLSVDGRMRCRWRWWLGGVR